MDPRAVRRSLDKSDISPLQNYKLIITKNLAKLINKIFHHFNCGKRITEIHLFLNYKQTSIWGKIVQREILNFPFRAYGAKCTCHEIEINCPVPPMVYSFTYGEGICIVRSRIKFPVLSSRINTEQKILILVKCNVRRRPKILSPLRKGGSPNVIFVTAYRCRRFLTLPICNIIDFKGYFSQKITWYA